MKKLYYTIGEVSELTGAEQHMLRYWETKIRQFKPRKNRAGNRVYTDDDIKIASRLKVLIVDQGHSVDGAQRAIESTNNTSEQTVDQNLKRNLQEIKQFLISIREKL